MCGIAGYKTQKHFDDKVLKRMVNALYHRGPDTEGFYLSEMYNAGMRRLSINDLQTGNQPLFNEDKSVVLFYNGEIYNSPQLRVELESYGHKFRTHSDGEVICHLYEEYGEGLFEKLDGMFAVALWIASEQKLILSRDIPGEKPLYYALLSKNELVFSSELKSLRFFPDVDFTLNRQALWDFPTFLWIPEPDTVYKSIKALLPGHMLIADNNGIRLCQYPNCFNRNDIGHDDESVIKETRRVVEDAIVSRLLSDVPVGTFLSSGLDSSIVTTIASRYLDNLSTFTIGFEDVDDPYGGNADESLFSEAYAKKLGANHTTVRVTSSTFRENLATFCNYGDQPFAVSSGLGILLIAKAAKEAGIKVLLSGDGADECFGGYSWYRHLNAHNLNGNHSYYHNDCSNLTISYQNFGIPIEDRIKILSMYAPQERAWAWHYYAAEGEKKHLFSPDFFQDLKPSTRYFYGYNSEDQWSANDFITQDRLFYFPNEMLRKVDRMTMAFSVEGRVPFAAPAVLSHADKLSFSHMIRRDTLKWCLREAFKDILPEEIISRPKHGFNVPIDHWLNGEWLDLVEDAFSKNSALYRNGIIHDRSCDVAKAMLKDKSRLNGHTIFCFIMLNFWLEFFN
jgi:asparagine synthase (glutamine-hydrolysing)